MCGFDRGGGGQGEKPTNKQPKLGLLTTQRKSDVAYLFS